MADNLGPFDAVLSRVLNLDARLSMLELRLGALETQFEPLLRLATNQGELETLLVKLAADILLFNRPRSALGKEIEHE